MACSLMDMVLVLLGGRDSTNRVELPDTGLKTSEVSAAFRLDTATELEVFLKVTLRVKSSPATTSDGLVEKPEIITLSLIHS